MDSGCELVTEILFCIFYCSN